jgi:hypothetical protein
MRAQIRRASAGLHLLAVFGIAACQDGAASNPDRQTHMGSVHAAAEPAPPLPPAPSHAVPMPLTVAMPNVFSSPSAPPPALAAEAGSPPPGAGAANAAAPPRAPKSLAH